MPARPAWRSIGLAGVVCVLCLGAWCVVTPARAQNSSPGTFANGPALVEFVHECVRARTGGDTCPIGKDQFALRAYVDLPDIAERVGGGIWQKASPPERERFLELVAGIVQQEITETFGDRSVIVKSERALPGGEMLVAGEYTAKNDRATRLSWLIGRKADRMLLKDISVDGISFVVAARDQIQTLAAEADGSLDSLIAIIRKRYVRPVRP